MTTIKEFMVDSSGYICDKFACEEVPKDALNSKKEETRLQSSVVQASERVFSDMQAETTVARKSSRKVQQEEHGTEVLRTSPLQSDGSLPIDLESFIDSESRRLHTLFDKYWSEEPKLRFFAWGPPPLESEMIEKWLRCFLSGLHSPFNEEFKRQKAQGRLFFDVTPGRGTREAYELAHFLTWRERVFLDWCGGFNKVWFVLH